MKAKNILLAIFLTLIILDISFAIYSVFKYTNPSNLSLNTLFYSSGKLAGLIGFLFLSILIFSGETARFFDKFLGIDKIIKFQRKFSWITTIFVLSHPIFFLLSTQIAFSSLIPSFMNIPLAAGVVSLYIFLIVMISSVLYKRISYNTWQFIHILVYLLFFFIFYHALNIGSDTRNILIMPIFSVIFIVMIIGSIYRINYKFKQRSFKCYVEEIKTEILDTFTLKIKSNKKLFFKAGQFCFLRLNKDKLYARHPFTISSSPNENTLNFTLKITGRFTKIASQLKKGDKIIVEGGFGLFTIKDEDENINKKKLVFIAGGVGITPFRSIIKDEEEKNNIQNSLRSILLLYGSKTEKDIIFKKEFDELDKKEKWLKKVYVLSQENEEKFNKLNDKYEKGHIDELIIKKYLDEKDIKDSLFYICGPESMKNSVIKILTDLGVKKENIFIEDFFW